MRLILLVVHLCSWKQNYCIGLNVFSILLVVLASTCAEASEDRSFYRQSRQSLPFMLAVLTYRFTLKTQAIQRTTLSGVGECVYLERVAYVF